MAKQLPIIVDGRETVYKVRHDHVAKRTRVEIVWRGAHVIKTYPWLDGIMELDVAKRKCGLDIVSGRSIVESLKR